MSLIEPKPSPRPWFAVWRRESGSFAQLPLLARALFTEVLKLTDDDGVIDIGTREPAEAIAWALGADRADRRALAKYVPLLLADGCLVHEGSTLRAPSFLRWQPTPKRPKGKPQGRPKQTRTNPERATTEPRNEREEVATEPRSSHEAATTEPRTCHEEEGNPAESFTSGSHSKGKERKGEDIERASSARVRDSGPLAVREALIARLLEELNRGWGQRYAKRLAVPAPATHRAELKPLASWCAEYLEAHPGDPSALVEKLLAGFWSRPDLKRPRPKWLAEDPGRYLGGVDGRTGPAKGRSDRLEPGTGAGFSTAPILMDLPIFNEKAVS